MKKQLLFTIMSAVIALGLFSCKEADSQNENPPHAIESENYKVYFSREKNDHYSEIWEDNKPKKYSFLYRYSFSIDDVHYKCAKVTVKGETSTVEFFTGTIDDSLTHITQLSDKLNYDTPKAGDKYYITSLDDLFSKADEFYSENKDVIEGQNYFSVFCDANYNMSYAFIDDAYFVLCKEDYSGYDADMVITDGEFVVNVTDFQILGE